MRVGELLICVGITFDNEPTTIFAIISEWSFFEGPQPTATEDLYFTFCIPSDDVSLKVNVDTDLDTVLAYRMADDRSSCMLVLPYECRRQP